MFAAVARAALGLMAAGALVLLPAPLLAANVPVPELTGRVVDLTGALSTPDRQTIEAKLAAFEQKKGSQVAVLVMPSLGGETIEEFATRVTDRWKLGRAGVDDGVLLLVAMQERRMRIQVGRGLEGALTDALSKRIIAEQMTPLFRAGDLPGGINAGVDGILAAAAGEALPPPRQSAGKPASVKVCPGALPFLILILLALVPFVAVIMRELMGRFFGAAAAGGLVGGAVFLFAGVLLAAVAAGAIVFFFTMAMEPFAAAKGRGSKRNWDWISTSGGSSSGGGSWGGGGGGFSGGGGGFSGGGASGSW